MRKTLCAMCMASMFGIGAGVSAQYDSKAKDQMGKKDPMKNGQVAVSGCVAAGSEPGKYMLSNAKMNHDMMGHDMAGKDHMAKDQMAKTAAKEDHAMSFELVGGTDLKAHLGHKVEVTGNLSKSDMNHMSKMDNMDKGEKDKMMADKHMKAMQLNVKSVKMVSASCM